MSKKSLLIVLALLLIGVLCATYNTPKVRAATVRSFYLTGDHLKGWNDTIPGPTIIVEQGDTVNLTLTSADVTHRFFLSYHNSSTPQAGDPQSPDFTATIVYSFTATNTPRTYTYYCYYHPSVMHGLFKVVATGSIPEFPAAIVAPLFIALTLLAVALLKRKR
jgi:FtsP/CotA-like multicopper oxidase with cupredoxin domain